MKRSTLVIVVLVVAALGIGGLFVLANRSDDEPNDSNGSTSQTQQPASDQDTTQTPEANNTSNQTATDEVEIEDFAFTPASISVKKGTTVTWTNKDSVQHSVVPDQESDAFKASDLLAKDSSYSFTFNTPGTYSYHCGPHPNMTGTVTVTN